MKKIHLVCNAHLDPVWLWDIEEGLAEASASSYETAQNIFNKYFKTDAGKQIFMSIFV